MNIIALILGWLIGFCGPVIFPQTPWPLWVAGGSAVTWLVCEVTV